MILTILVPPGGFLGAVALGHDRSLQSSGVAEAGEKSDWESRWGCPLKNRQGDSMPGRGEDTAHRASMWNESWEPEVGFTLEKG